MTAGMRSPIAVIVSRFPLVTETFILREIIELERQGQPVRLVPLLRETPPVVHREAEPWTAKAWYTPFLSLAILAANSRAFWRGPRRYLGLLVRVLFRSLPSSNLFFGALGVFPKAVYLAERLLSEGIGHVHAHFATHPAMAAYLIHHLSGISYSFTAHAHDIFVHRAMLGEKIRAASFVRAISGFNRAFLMDRYAAAAEGKVHVARVGIDPGAPCPGDAGAGEDVSILSVAALKPYKGLSVLIEACAILKSEGLRYRCDIVGEGPERGALERRIGDRALDGLVRLVGAEPQHRVAERMRAADLFVLPSVVAADGQMEGIPVALMEAMALEKPVVASSLSGIPELVENEASGLLVEPGDAEALARALRRLVEDPALARRMGRRARERVISDYRLDTCVSRLLERIDAVREDHAESSWPSFLVPRAGVRALHEGRDARVAELLLADGFRPKDVVLKIHRAHPGQSAPPAERARREYEVLRRLVSLSVPRPLQIDESAGALLMEACRGVRLDAVLRRARTSPFTRFHREAESALREAGRWLRDFQSETRTGESGNGRLRELVDKALADLEGLSTANLPSLRAGALRQRLEACARAGTERVQELSGRHGDFWPGNVFVGATGVQVIDFEGYGPGLPLEDAAWFTLHLELLCAYPFLRRVRERYSRAFLDGYLEGRPLDRELFALCRAAKAIEMIPRANGSGRPLLRPWRLGILTAAFCHE